MSTDSRSEEEKKSVLLSEHLRRHGRLPWRESLELILSLEPPTASECSAAGLRPSLVEDTTDSAPRRRLVLERVSADAKKKDSTFHSYISPEEALSHPADEHSMVYSLGCILFECLTGKPPFESGSAQKLAELHVAGIPPSPSRAAALSLPPGVDAIVLKCLAKDPGERYSTIAELNTALRESLEESQENIKENDIKEKVEPAAGKTDASPLVVSLIAVALLAGLAMAASFTVTSDRFKERIKHTRDRGKNIYYLSSESPDYRIQKDFEDGRPIPPRGKIPIQILHRKTGKVLFATTLRKTFKEAVQEAHNRHLRLWGADLSGQDLSGLDLSGAFLREAFLIKTNLKGTRLERANLQNADLSGANLENANLQSAWMELTNLEGANLTGADL
ncbi:MAG: pentapeptide repeat-containing protein, partial [Cyanobacteria bacterium HKST-UBA02]|nr:pentapeptide repeat-containing protein [Cyanobacteria bacterium HKST-UBA02]